VWPHWDEWGQIFAGAVMGTGVGRRGSPATGARAFAAIAAVKREYLQ